jgi:hypothetical protein
MFPSFLRRKIYDFETFPYFECSLSFWAEFSPFQNDDDDFCLVLLLLLRGGGAGDVLIPPALLCVAEHPVPSLVQRAAIHPAAAQHENVACLRGCIIIRLSAIFFLLLCNQPAFSFFFQI